MAKRMETLDSLRGLAALSVVLHHSLIAFPIFYAPYVGQSVTNYPNPEWIGTMIHLLSYTPLHILWGGHEAVILFFILSGFVLALPYLDNSAPPYGEFVLKRICRIYIPYIFTVAISLTLFIYLAPSRIPQLSDWFNTMWAEPITTGSLLDYGLMTGRSTHNVNTVIWTLIHEMRISFVFPILVRLVASRGWRGGLAFSGALSAAGLLLLKSVHFPGSLSICATLYYTGFFMLGATVAKYRFTLGEIIQGLSLGQRFMGMVGMVILLAWRWEFANVPVFGHLHVAEWAIGAGAVLSILAALNIRSWVKALSAPWLVWLGKVSYSLYLIHVIVLLTLIHSLNGSVPPQTFPFLILAVSIAVAGIYYALVEHPSMRLGKFLASRFRFLVSSKPEVQSPS